MLIRNLNTANGLCNGTRLQIKKLSRNILHCTFIAGPRKGELVLVPRIELHSDQGNCQLISIIIRAGMSFTLKRQQFPVRLAFAMSLNKAQGQSLTIVGLDLTDEVFAHGHLYVGITRATSSSGLKVKTKDSDGKTANIVDQSVL